jgi:hypothetical protein
MSNLFWLGVGGAAVYLLTRKNQIAPAATLPAPELPSINAAPIVPADDLCSRWRAYSQAANTPGLSVSAWHGPIPQNCLVSQATPLDWGRAGGWGLCPPGQVYMTEGIMGGRCVPGVSVAPAYPGGPV